MSTGSMRSEEQFNHFFLLLIIKDINEFVSLYAPFYVIGFSKYSYMNMLLRCEIQISVCLIKRGSAK